MDMPICGLETQPNLQLFRLSISTQKLILRAKMSAHGSLLGDKKKASVVVLLKNTVVFSFDRTNHK